MAIAQIHTPCETDLLQVTDEAVHFMRRFGQAIQQSAAHVYVSAIPLTPPSSILFKTYARTLQNIPKLIYGNETSTLSTDVHLEGKYVLAPDRSWFVYARKDSCNLWIWDVAKGIAIDGPLVGHNSAVRRIRFSKDGKKFCSIDAENQVIVWDATSHQTIGVPVQLSSEAENIALCGNKVVVRHNHAGLVCIWDVTTGSLEKDYVEEEYVTLQGAYFIAKGRIVNAMTGEDVTSKYSDGREITEAIFSRDDTRVLIRTKATNGLTDSVLHDVDSGNVIAHLGAEWTSFAADGKHLIAQNGSSKSILDLSTGMLAFGPFEIGSSTPFVDLSFDGTRFLVIRDGKSAVMDLQSGQVIATWDWSPFSSDVLSSDGTRVIRKEQSSIIIFNVASCSSNHNAPLIKSIAPSPTARQLLLLLSDNTLHLVVDMPSKPTVVLHSAISPAAFSPDGSIIISAYPNHALQLWHSKDATHFGKPLLGHTMAITAVAFSPNGSKVISASHDGTIRIWNSPPEGKELVHIAAYSDIRAISLSPDESKIICVSRIGVIQLVDTHMGSAISRPSTYDWRWAECLPNGREIICISAYGQFSSIDTQTGQIIEHPNRKIIKDAAIGIGEAVFSPTKTDFLCISRVDTIKFSDQPMQQFMSNTRLISSSDDKWMISMHRLHFICRVCMWDKESGWCIWESVEELYAGNFPVMAISCSGKKTVISGTSACQVRDTASGMIISSWDTHVQWVESVAFSLDEGNIFVITNAQVETWDIESGTLISTENMTIGETDLEPTVVDTSSRRQHPVLAEQWTLSIHNILSGANTVISEIDHSLRLPTFSPGGSKIAAMVADEFIYVWETHSGVLLTKSPALKDGTHVHSLCFSPNGNQLLIYAMDDGWASQPIWTRMWHINDEDNCIIEFDHNPLATFFSNTSQIVTMSSEYNEWQIWDIESTPQLLSTSTCTLAQPGLGDIPVISPDGTRLFACNRLWDINDFSFRELASFNAYTSNFSPNSKLTACSGYDGTCIFDAVTGTMLYKSHHCVNTLSFSPDSKQLFCFDRNQKCILVTNCSLMSFNEDFISHVYHPDSMMRLTHGFNLHNGWYQGINGARLIWVPENMRAVWFATGSLGFSTQDLILGQTVNDLTILDMEDYLCSLPIKGAWREGGIQYVDRDEEQRASALASSSGLLVRISQMAHFVADTDIDVLNWLRTIHSVFHILRFQ